jgi:hypothetical protein
MRQFTKYYVQFANGVIMGFESHHLDLVTATSEQQ